MDIKVSVFITFCRCNLFKLIFNKISEVHERSTFNPIFYDQGIEELKNTNRKAKIENGRWQMENEKCLTTNRMFNEE